MEDLHPFWTVLVKPGETVKVEYPESCFLSITNICLIDLPSDDKKTSPVRLIAKVQNFNSQDKSDPKEVLLASLIPYSSEHSQVNYIFTPINDVSLTVSGNASIQVSGYIQPIFLDEEEEEEANEANDEEEK